MRIEWIDIAKGIGIILVIMGHTINDEISRYIYGFHMPLFFFLSGLCCKPQKYSFSQFVRSKTASLIIPYLFFFFVTYLIWLPMSGRDAVVNELPWWKPLCWVGYGAFAPTMECVFKSHKRVLWFLPCLFCTEILFYVVAKCPQRWHQWILVLLCLVVGVLIPINLPWGINNALVALIFFYLGYRGAQKLNNKYYSCVGAFLVCDCLWAGYFLIMHYTGFSICMSHHGYRHIYGLVLIPLLGIVALCVTAKWVGGDHLNWLGQTSPIAWLGKNSLTIFATHYVVLRIWRFILPKIWATEDVAFAEPLHALIITIIVIVTLLPVCYLYNRFIRPIIIPIGTSNKTQL